MDIVLLFILLINANEGGGYIVPLILLALKIASCVATNVYGITIPRFSNAVSVMLLIYWTTTERAIESEV